MEAQLGGGEVRRLHIIYFLSRKGRIEHPHLIRVHHLSRNGVHLRDVKRWLSELRGKDMPESYAWSYKRRYKTGFVWQDLLDEDIITPISDNEFVLKGSKISSTTFDLDVSSFAEKEDCARNKAPSGVEPKANVHQTPYEHLQTPMDNMLTKPLLEIDEESPPFSSEISIQSDDSTKLDEENHANTTKEEETTRREKREKCDNVTPFYSTFLIKKSKKKINQDNFKDEKAKTTDSSSSSSSSSKSTFAKNKSYSNINPSSMFRNLLTCGAVDTNDSGMVMINRKSTCKGGGIKLEMAPYKPNGGNKMTETCRGEALGGSERIARVSWNQHEQNGGRKSCDASMENKKSEMNSQRPAPPPYKPINGPKCSQCGKTFRPEKLHTHMKSCRGMKALARGGSTPVSSATQQRSTDTPPRPSISSHYLIHK